MGFLKALLQLIGLVKKYEPIAEEAYKAGKPLVEDALKSVKKAKK